VHPKAEQEVNFFRKFSLGVGVLNVNIAVLACVIEDDD